MKNSIDALDLYAKVEDMIGIKEAAPRLYAHYLLALQNREFDSLLDIGCGSGDFLKNLISLFPSSNFLGIDLSPYMVKLAKEKGINAKAIPLEQVDGKFDVITCVFDMLNYLSTDELIDFLKKLNSHLNRGGWLICDINTLYGFKEVAVGAFINEDENRFVAIESDYERGIYQADFTLFEKSGSCWSKSSQTINQYYHTPQEIASFSGLEIVSNDEVMLYSDEDADKLFLILEKS